MAAPRTGSVLLAVLVWAVTLSPADGRRKQPPPPLVVVQGLKPTGLRVSVADEAGMDVVVINADINAPLEPKETGKISHTVVRSQDGFWTVEDASLELKPDDTVFYWVHVSSGHGRRNFVGHRVISEFVDSTCKPSVTTVNGQPACKGALVFEDSFTTFNRTTWKHNIQIWPEQFCTFVSNEENTFVKDGVLHLKPTALTDEAELSKPLTLEGCTATSGSESCEIHPFAWKIVPPTRSAWITTTSSFKFVKIELRAKPAAGDWLYSGIYLYPRQSEYGGGFDNGEIVIMRGSGNEDLRYGDDRNHGANEIDVQAAGATCNRIFADSALKNLPNRLYTDTFHTYALTWTSREINFEVDGEVIKRIAPPQPDGFLSINEFRDCDNSQWEKGSFMAPFDKEFTLDFAINVGGFYQFPDNSKSGKNTKPWRNRTPRALLDFWRARDTWLPTWKGDFEIDYVRMWAV